MGNGNIDWSEIHHRIEAANTAIEGGWEPTPEEKKRVLRMRAKALAQVPKREDEAGASIEVVEFLLAHERYGIESSYIREVYSLKEFTPVPCTPPFVLGLINVRGQIHSVIDIKKFFELPDKGISDLNKVIIVHGDHTEFGILADAVLGVQSIALGDLQPSLPTLTGIREEYLKGVTKDRMVILDAKKLLADKNIIVHEEVG